MSIPGTSICCVINYYFIKVKLISRLTVSRNEAKIINNMVNYTEPQLNDTFAALSDPTRRAILARLAGGVATVSEIAEPFDISLPAVSKHLRVLESAGLLSRRIEGRTHYCRLNAAPLQEASSWLANYETFWQGQLDSLARYLDDNEGEPDQ